MKFRDKYPTAQLGAEPQPGIVLTDRIYSCFIYFCKNRTGWHLVDADGQSVPMCSDECLAAKREWDADIARLAKRSAMITNVGPEKATAFLVPAEVATAMAAAVGDVRVVPVPEPAKEESPKAESASASTLPSTSP